MHEGYGSLFVCVSSCYSILNIPAGFSKGFQLMDFSEMMIFKSYTLF